jgi:2-aminobenzoylacetyl-CoA thioesterase
MWIKASGRLSDTLFQLTTAVSSHLLITGEVSALIDSSVGVIYGKLVDELDRSLEGSELKYILITHTHFDHIGAVPQLKRLFPEVSILASPYATELLANSAYRSMLFDRNRVVAEALKGEWDMTLEEWSAGLTVDRVVSDGDVVDLGGGLDVKVVALPGHTEDLLGYYVPEDGAIAAAEAFGGYHGREKCSPSFLYGYDCYIESIDKVLGLDIRFLNLPHGGTLSGDLGRRFLSSTRLEAERFKAHVIERIAQGELLQEIASSIISEWRLSSYAPDGPFNVLLEEGVQKMVLNVSEDR